MLTRLDRSQRLTDLETFTTMEMIFTRLWELNWKKELGMDTQLLQTLIVGICDTDFTALLIYGVSLWVQP